MKRALLGCLLLLLGGEFAAVQADSYTAAEIQQLRNQLGSNADQALLSDLQSPNLLPADGSHKAEFVWDATKRLMTAAPPAARQRASALSLGLLYPRRDAIVDAEPPTSGAGWSTR